MIETTIVCPFGALGEEVLRVSGPQIASLQPETAVVLLRHQFTTGGYDLDLHVAGGEILVLGPQAEDVKR